MVDQQQSKQHMKRTPARQRTEAPRTALQSEPPDTTITPSTAPDALGNTTSAGAATRRPTPRRTRIARDVDLPAVAPCKDMETLRQLTPDATRHHVHRYLHTAMPAEQANDFEALAYRWELHLVELDHIQLLRQVDLNRRKLSRYRTALRKGSSFPPLVALGGDGAEPTEGVLLCDGYHRIIAMRDIGLNFAWVWLAVGLWREQPSTTNKIPMLSGSHV